jgi:hypothetical protein
MDVCPGQIECEPNSGKSAAALLGFGLSYGPAVELAA